jgi:hypothetical protein
MTAICNSHVLEEVKIRQDNACSCGNRVNTEEEFISADERR